MNYLALLNTTGNISNKTILYVWVPQTKSGCSFLTQNQTFESANRMSITNHIIQFYCNSFLTACKTQWHICKPMSATQFQAMLDITERLVAQVKGNWKCTSVLTLTKASVPPGKVSTCWPRATGTSIMALWNLSTVVRRMPSSLSGPRKTSTTKLRFTYRGIWQANQSPCQK